jgi:hypothetical protein
MIRPLRAWHRRLVVLVAFVVVLLALAAWSSREPVPTVERLPSSSIGPVSAASPGDGDAEGGR